MVNDENDKWSDDGELPIGFISNFGQEEKRKRNTSKNIIGSNSKVLPIDELEHQVKNVELNNNENQLNDKNQIKEYILNDENQIKEYISKENKEIKNKLSKLKDDLKEPNYLKDFGKYVKSLESTIDQLAERLKTYTDLKGAEAIPKGSVETKKYRNYYDVIHTISTATADDPLDFDSSVYQRERIFIDLQRFAEKLMVTNEGPGILYIIISHGGEVEFSQETPIYAGDTKWYYNVYELRVRSPTAGLIYRVSEYDIHTSGSTGFVPIEKANLHNQALPAINTNWLAADIIPTNSPSTFMIEVAVSIAGNFSAVITQGGNAQTVMFNVVAGPALIAGGLYIFDMMVHSGDSVNFIYSTTGGTIQVFRVQELDSASA